MGNAVFNLITGIIIAAVSAWVTVQLSIRCFRSEKWWERRVEAYERVIEALHHSKAFSDAHIEADASGQVISEERDQELRARSKAAHLEIERAADIGGFLLGNEARERLRQYQREAHAATETLNWQEYLQNDWAATNSCLEDIIKIAKHDLGTN